MLTYEDFTPGRVFQLGPRKVSAEEIIEFAEEFDPQPFHIDAGSEQAAQVGGLIASGWHTCSIFMRMLCDSYLLDTASLGSAGLDEVRWLRPVRPGDILSGSATVTDRRVSSKRANLGLVSFDYELHNQQDQPVMTIRGMGMMEVENRA